MEKTQTVRNGKIEFLRFIFSIIIVIHHSRYIFGDKNCLFLGGSLAVEFFFLVSGYLMMATIEKIRANKPEVSGLGQETFGFICKKVKAVYPDLLIAWVIAIVFAAYATKGSVVKLGVDSFFEAMLVKMGGLPATSINGVTWYISSMLLCMAVLYPLIRKFPDMLKYVVLPLLVILSMGYLAGEFGTPRNPTLWIGFTMKGNIRALAEISLGAVIYHLVKEFQKMQLSWFGKLMVTLVEWAAYVIVIRYMYNEKATERDYFFIVVMAVAVLLSFSHQGIDAKIFDNRFVGWLGKWSLPLYLGHTYYSYHLNKVLPEDTTDITKWVVYGGCTVVTSFAIWGLSVAVKKLTPMVARGTKRLLIKKTDA